MSLLIAATVLPLVPVAAGDGRFDRRRTFVSDQAEIALAEEGGEEVFCLDRKRQSICLVRSEWAEAVALANSAPKRGPRAFIPQNTNAGTSSQAKYGLASSPSTFRSR